MQITDIEVMVNSGLPSAYASVETSFSTLSNRYVMMHLTVPGLSGLVQTDKGPVLVMFADSIPEYHEAAALMLGTQRRRDLEGDEHVQEDKCLYVVQQGSYAWQSMGNAQDCEEGLPAPFVVFLQWRPGAFGHAIEAHHGLIRSLPMNNFLIGSELEKVSLSTLLLSSGLSSIADTVANQEWFRSVLDGDAVTVADHPFVIQAKKIKANWSYDLTNFKNQQ